MLLVVLSHSHAPAEDAFRKQVMPFLKSYCVKCHNQQTSEGELDLTRYTSAAEMGADFRQWEHVVTFLKKEEMPPEGEQQPSAAQRAEVLQTLQKVLQQEAGKVAGDPGVVLPRRLSNAEYNYTIRDLTGVDIRPTKSFPVDPAAGEGFNNTGEALLMSPALFKKYYAAAQHVAEHVRFTPAGLDFAPYPIVSYADQKKFHEQAIIQFYERHNVEYERYLAAAWSFRNRVAAERPISIVAWAERSGLSSMYLHNLWNLLSGDPADGGFPINWLRKRWNAVSAPSDAAAPKLTGQATQQLRILAFDIRQLSRQLCRVETPAIVSNAGNGPIQHIDRRTKSAAERDRFNESLLSDSRRSHVEFRDLNKTQSISLFLQITNVAAAGPEGGYVILKDLNFSRSAPNRYKPNDAKQNLPLQDILKQHAPDELQKFNFGTHPLGHEIDSASAALPTDSLLEIKVPTAAFKDTNNIHFYIDGKLDHGHSKSKAARVVLWNHKPTGAELAKFTFPLIDPNHAFATRLKAACQRFCTLFPNRFFYVDDTRGLSAGFHLIEGFFRDDQPLCKHVLNEQQNQELNRLWDELAFATNINERMLRGFVFFERSERNFMKHPDFDSIKEEDPDLLKPDNLWRFEKIYLERSRVKATPEEFEALRSLALQSRASAKPAPESIPDLANHPIHLFFQQVRDGLSRRTSQLKQAEGIYLRNLQEFAAAAYRRPLTKPEQHQLEDFFHGIARQAEFSTEAAVRASITRILVSPYFCYRIDLPPDGNSVKPIPDVGLASRLSYFLWSSKPDTELMALATAGKLNNPKTLQTQTRRMLKDAKVSGFALEFFGQWLRYRDFLQQESVSREVFRDFDEPLKQAMFEEPTRFITDLIQNDRPVTDLLHSNSTFINKRLAQHYGLPFDASTAAAGSGMKFTPATDWQRAEGIQQRGRGGLLGMAVFLTKNSQPQRTSPVKRGFWVIHKLLGEHIPAPPADVAVLPSKETDTNGMTIRELLALHTDDIKCARCHQRFDFVGLSMEGFDAIGRNRSKDLAGRPIDNVVRLPSGKEARGVPDFSKYLVNHRKQDFVKTLNHKLLGYALGRSLQLSDQPLLDKLQRKLAANDDRFVTLFETIVTSPQFRKQRCRDFTAAEFKKELATSDSER